MKELNDYELVSQAQEKSEDAQSILIQKYKPLINKISTKYFSILNKGTELSDIKQECLIAFLKAIENFNDKENACFYTYVTLCMEKHLINITRKLKRPKHTILDDAISIESLTEEVNTNFLKEESTKENPLYTIIEDEEYALCYNKIINKLSPFEECVVTLKVQNFSYSEIAEILDKDKKSIHNTIQRIKKKIKKDTSLI